jgi:FkbM family methyltransferase
VLECAADIRTAYSLLADHESRELFVNHIEWRLFLDYDLLPLPSPEPIYFSGRFTSLLGTEVLYDVGAYTGDSVSAFLASARGHDFREVHAFEPASENFTSLERYIASLGELKARIHAHKMALGNEEAVIQIESEHGPASRVGRGDDTVRMTTIDGIGTGVSPPTFIKIDIEGFEPQCLQGAKATISGAAPAIAVCVYHMQSHIWSILLQLHSYYPGYSFRLCPHLADGWDLVLYAVPEHRLPRSANTP